MSVLSVEEFEKLVTADQVATETKPISQRNVLSIEEVEALGAVEESITSPTPGAQPTMEQNVYGALSNKDRTFYENIQESFKRGDQAQHIYDMGYEASLGRMDLEKDITPIRFELSKLHEEDPVKSSNRLADAIYSISGMIPALGTGIVKGTEAGLAMGIGSAAVGAPQAAPAAFAAGQTVMSANYWYRQGAGELYLDLKDEDVDDAVAVPVSHFAGALYGAIEFSQAKLLAPNLKPVARSILKASSKKFVAYMLAKYGVNWVEQVGEEGLQAVVMSIAQDTALGLGDKVETTTRGMLEKAMSSGWTGIKEAFLPLGLMMIPGAAISTGHKINQRKALKQAQDIVDKMTMEEKLRVEEALKAPEETEAEQETETAEEVDPKAEEIKAQKARVFDLQREEVAILNEDGTIKLPEQSRPGVKSAPTKSKAERLKVTRDRLRKAQFKLAKLEKEAKEPKAPEAKEIKVLEPEAPVPDPSADAEAKERREKGFEKNAKVQEKKRAGKRAKGIEKTGRSAQDLAEKLFTPTSSVLRRMSQKLRDALIAFEFKLQRAIQSAEKTVLPFLKAAENMTQEDFDKLDYALKRGTKSEATAILKKYGLEKEFSAVQALLKSMFERGKAAGIHVKELADYFPRVVDDFEGLMKHMKQTEHWDAISKALRDYESKRGQLSEEDRVAFVNRFLAKMPDSNMGLPLPGAAKARSIEVITPEMNEFYKPFTTALMDYVTQMNTAIESNEFFGVKERQSESEEGEVEEADSARATENTIGAYVGELLAKNEIDGHQAKVLLEALKARFNQGHMGRFIGTMKDLTYIDLLGGIGPAIRQFGDMATGLHRNGYFRQGKSFLQRVFGSKGLEQEDLGITTIGADFIDGRSTATWTRKILSVALGRLDRFSKAVNINASLASLQDAAKAPTAEFKAQLASLFGDEAQSVIDDLQNHKNSENVRLLLFSELSEFTPTSPAEMPVQYNQMGNGRIFYALKIYQIKQIDFYRTEIVDQFATDPLGALKNMVSLTTALALTGAGAESILAILLGKDFDLSDAVVNNMFKLIGFNNYLVSQANRQGPLKTALEIAVPPSRFIDNLVLDVADTIQNGTYPTEWESTRSIPLAGELFYWWIGAGSHKKSKGRGEAPSAP